MHVNYLRLIFIYCTDMIFKKKTIIKFVLCYIDTIINNKYTI